MNDRQRRMFEVDRRMELRLRLVAKRAGNQDTGGGTSPLSPVMPERDLVTRLIEKVRRL